MSEFTDEILDELNDDEMYFGMFTDMVEENDKRDIPLEARVKQSLHDLLASEKVEIGVFKASINGSVEFVAWTGTIAKRVARAMESFNKRRTERTLSYWLILRKHVSRFEGG